LRAAGLERLQFIINMFITLNRKTKRCHKKDGEKTTRENSMQNEFAVQTSNLH